MNKLATVVALLHFVGGSEYYMGAMKGVGNGAIKLELRSGDYCNVTLYVGQSVTTHGVLPGTTTEVSLPEGSAVTDHLDRRKGIRVLSNASVSIVLFQEDSDAYRVLPYLSAGAPYADQHTYYAVGTSQGSQVLLVGCVDDTMVTVSPSQDVVLPDNVQDANSGSVMINKTSSKMFELNEIDTLLIESGKDLTGTKIVSDKPLTVLSGAQCGAEESCSFTVEQLPPTSAWGRTYLLAPVLHGGYVVVASQNDTTVNHTCITDGQMFLGSEGDAEQLTAQTNCHLVADAPVMVMQYVSVANAAITTLMSPVEQYVREIVVYPLSSSCGNDGTVTLAATDKASLSVLLQWTPVRDGAGTNVGYLATLDELSVATVTNTSKLTAIAYFLNDACSYGYNAGYDLSPLPVSTVFFTSTNYVVNEDIGTIEVEIRRVDVLESRLPVVVLGNDGVLLREVVVFDVGENRKNLNVQIVDDSVVKENETYHLLLKSDYPANIGNDSIFITVLDNDNVTVKVTDLSYDGGTTLSVKVGIVQGAIVGVCVELAVTTTGASIVYHVQLTSFVVAHTATIDLALLTPNLTDESTISILLNTSNKNVAIPSPNTTVVLKDILEPNPFVVSEFTRLTLLVTVCLCGAVLVLLFMAAVVCIAVGLFCYRRGKRWRISETNIFSPHGDSVSVSTANPDTYELMNRLGENKMTSLLINDDRDFAGL